MKIGNVTWGEYMRIRVRLDITQPLLRRKKFTIRDLQPVWIQLSYERLCPTTAMDVKLSDITIVNARLGRVKVREIAGKGMQLGGGS